MGCGDGEDWGLMGIEFEPENPNYEFTNAEPDRVAETDQTKAALKDQASVLNSFYVDLVMEGFHPSHALVLTQQWFAMSCSPDFDE